MSKLFSASQLTGGGSVRRLEKLLAAHYQMRFAVCMSSATMGLLGVALALDLRGEDFITTPLTYGGSLSSWLLLGNRPAFVDVEPGTVVIDPDRVRAAVTRRTRAILAVDLLGYPVDVQRLRTVACEHGLFLVVDSAQGFGASRNGRPAGCGADAVVVSFTSGKALDVGEGGAVLTDDPTIHERLVWWTQHPLRQKRDLGLDLTNQFAMNGRIHPVAARAATRRWHSAVQRCEQRRTTAERHLLAFAAAGLIEPPPSRDWRPSYLRALAVPRAAAISSLPLDLAPLPVDYLPSTPAFQALYRGTEHECRQARRMLHSARLFVARRTKARRLE